MTYNFSINDFEGPLDLLLHLVRQSKMDIYEMDLHILIDQYLQFIHDMENLNIDIASEYLVMSCELVHLKSRMLIHKEEEKEEESEFELQSEEDLRNKILEYDAIKKLTNEFRTLEEKRSEVFTKLPENLKNYQEEKHLESNVLSKEDLYQALIEFYQRKKEEAPLHTKITKKEISLESRVLEIKDILHTRKKVDFFSLFEIPTKEYIVVTFLAVLQMDKEHTLKITQENNFSPIIVEEVCIDEDR